MTLATGVRLLPPEFPLTALIDDPPFPFPSPSPPDFGLLLEEDTGSKFEDPKIDLQLQPLTQPNQLSFLKDAVNLAIGSEIKNISRLEKFED